MHYVLFYKFVENYLEARIPFRSEHLELASKAKESGELILAGALEDPQDEGMLIFKTDLPSKVSDFAHSDPYVKNSVVKHWVISKWNVAID
jgi:uncharacterized protein YciI